MTGASDMSEPTGSAGVPRRPVFILGAGFSKAIDARMPTSDELGEEVKALLAKNGRPLPAELTKGTFEEWLSRLAEDQPDLLEHENLQRRAWFSEISQAVAQVIEQRESHVRHGGAEPPPWLRSFIGAAHGWRATAITFNYDTLLETGVNLSSFHDFAVIVGSGLVRSCDVLGHLPHSAGSSETGRYSTFRLLKLHGSVNFYRTSGDDVGASLVRWPLEGETHIPTPSQADVFKDSMRDNIFGRRSYTPPGKMEAPAERQRRVLFGYEPFIVPPAALKSPYYSLTFLRGLWREAREAIAAASHLSLVGYSLPETDLVTVGLLRENLAAGARVFVVNRPNDDTREDVATRAERLLGRDVEAVHPDSEEAVKLWATDLAEQRSRETVRSVLSDLRREVEGSGTSCKVHVNVYPDNDNRRWCMKESAPRPVLACVDPVELLASFNDEPRWQPEEFLGTLGDLSESGSPLAVVGPDGNRRLVVDAFVKWPAGTSYDYGVHLQSVRT